jgi:hypothetical protein
MTSPECSKYLKAASFFTYIYCRHHAKYEDLLNALDMKPTRFKLIEQAQSKIPESHIMGCVIETNK